MVSEKVCGWLPPNPNKNVWEEQLKCEWTDWLRNHMWDIPYYENKKSLRTLFLASTPAETADWTPIPRQSYFSPWEPQSYLVPVPVPPKWVGLNITPKSYGLSSCFPLRLPYFCGDPHFWTHLPSFQAASIIATASIPTHWHGWKVQPRVE